MISTEDKLKIIYKIINKTNKDLLIDDTKQILYNFFFKREA